MGSRTSISDSPPYPYVICQLFCPRSSACHFSVRHNHVICIPTTSTEATSALRQMAEGERIGKLPSELQYIQYDNSLEKQYLPAIRGLISKDLSEPYSIYVYRYFLYHWGELCFMVSSLVYNSLFLLILF